MIIEEPESKELKTWVIRKLENISDADSDVLGDYVLALISADTPELELRANAIENLEDFLKDNTKPFVDDIFQAVHSKSYKPSYVAPTTSAIPSSIDLPSGPAQVLSQKGGGTQGSYQPKKRSYKDLQDGPQGQDFQYGSHERQMKQTRRGGMHNGGRESFNQNGGGNYNNSQIAGFPGMPISPTGLLFDPNDPMAAMMAMQAMGMPLPSLPGGPLTGFPPILPGPGKRKIDARCRDYDTKGICARGVKCPFNHGDNQIVVPASPAEYDPKSPSVLDFTLLQPGSNGGHQSDFRGRGRERGRGDRGGIQPPRRNKRAEFSLSGPNPDRSNTTVVVEQIPEENFSEELVRAFFATFGNIEEVTMKPYKRLALVEFKDYDSAKAAYESPKVIFDNRFVKVYWYNPSTLPSPGLVGNPNSPKKAIQLEEPAFDRAKFERETEAAQKRLEERQSLQQQNDLKLANLQKQKEELAQKQTIEKARLMEKLKAKGQSFTTEMSIDEPEQKNGTDAKASAKTEALRVQLKALEDEAKSLGLDPEPWASDRGGGRGRGRGRGSYRGWEGFAGRGGYDPSRGRGRGAFRGAPRAGGVFNLDNRPKTVKVEGATFDTEKDEGLKQFLFSVGEFAMVESSSSKNSKSITFKDRFTAEKFFYGPKDIPGVGKLEFSWVSTPLPPVSLPSLALNDGGDTVMGDTNMEVGSSKANGGGYQQDQRDVDYDVADGNDDWVS